MASGLENIETIESPFRRFVTTIGVFPTAFTDAMTYYECLAYLVKYLEDSVVPAVNENAEALKELQDYVVHYFDNLDVQEEINNKLDEMVEAGTLQEIIASYIQANTAWCFDSVTDMKSAENLINGSYAQTLGYYSANDGGKGLYKIRTVTNDDVIDEGSIIALDDDTLVAELIISDSVNLKQFGAKEDSGFDNSTILQKVIDFAKGKCNVIVNGQFELKNSVHIDAPVNMSGMPNQYSKYFMAGFNCTGNEDIIYFYFDEGAVWCNLKNLSFLNNKTATCFRFYSTLASDKRVWKNEFNHCFIRNFKKGFLFYGTGAVADNAYCSEISFNFCKIYNCDVCGEYNNVQAYNTNFIECDLESLSVDSPSVGFVLNSFGGISLDSCSVVLHDTFLKLGENDSMTPVNTFIGVVNIVNTRFETWDETVFDYTLTSRQAISQIHQLNISNTDFYLHNNCVLIDNNVKVLNANCDICITGSYTMTVNAQSGQGASEYSKILIRTATPDKIDVPYLTGAYRPWVIVNDNVKCSCVSPANSNNKLEYGGKIRLGYNKTIPVTSTSVFVPWDKRKFIINVNGAFIGNGGSITITNSDNSFTHTYTRSTTSYEQVHEEVYLPYKSDGDTYTITASNIWGNCYFE